MNDFDTHFVESGEFSFNGKSFRDFVLEINTNEPTAEFATSYIADAAKFLGEAIAYRKSKVTA